MTETPLGHTEGLELEGRRARKARMTRQALIAAGLAAFERQPPSLVSVLDITEAADVAKGVFYLHFASKDEFLLSLWEHVQGEFLSQLHSIPRPAEGGSKTLQVQAIIEQYATHAAAASQAACFALRMMSYLGDEIGPPGELTRRRSAYLNALASTFAGPDPTKRDTDIARVIDACCWGVIAQSLQLGEAVPAPRELVHVVLPAVTGLLDGVR